jgi:transcription initiation factor TFIIIB Brf1 subunit/transcription initiation factor TFIIB
VLKEAADQTKMLQKRRQRDDLEWKEDEDWQKAWKIAHILESSGTTTLEEIQATDESIGDDDDYEGSPDLCLVCETTTLSMDSAGLRLVCSKCGLIVENFTDEKPEWVVGTSDKGQSSTDTTRGDTINPLMPNASMNTEIVPNGRLAYRQYKMIKLSRWSAMTAIERSLCVVFNKIEKCGSRARVPGAVQYTTKTLFRRVYEINLKKHQSGKKREGLRGPKRDGLIAACNYLAFKVHNLYWKKDVVAAIYAVSAGEIRRGLSIYWDLMKDNPLNMAKITGCKQYIRWYAVELQLPHSITTFSIELFKELKRHGVGTSKQPQSTAAWCLWTVYQKVSPNGELKLERLSRVTGISKATITDVERITAGMEVPALTGIFAVDMCGACNITNAVTINKIIAVAKCLCRIPSPAHSKVTSNLPDLASFAVYFVLTVNDVRFDAEYLMHKCGTAKKQILNLAQLVVPFRDAIIDDCVGHVHFRDSNELIAPTLNPLLELNDL